MGVLAIIAEAMSLIKPGIEVGMELYEVFQRGKKLAESPTPATENELADFKKLIDEQKARLDANTAEIEKD